MRQKSVFAAAEGAYQHHMSKQISALRGKIGACQRQIAQDFQVQGNRQWISKLNGQISKIERLVQRSGQ